MSAKKKTKSALTSFVEGRKKDNSVAKPKSLSPAKQSAKEKGEYSKSKKSY